MLVYRKKIARCEINNANQKANRGNVTRVPLEKMPLVDMTFKRVVVDLTGHIYLSNDAEHIYIYIVGIF